MSLILLIVSLLIFILFLICLYLGIADLIRFIFANHPREPFPDAPDWGIIKEVQIPIRDNKFLDSWVVYPNNSEYPSFEGQLQNANPTIIFVHGWSRDKGRMVAHARLFAKYGYTSILFSVRDHGDSSKEFSGMSIVRFSQDIEDCISWWGHPVLIVAHSMGAGAALLTALKTDLIRGIIAEAPPYDFPHDFQYLYRPVFKGLTRFILPGITFVHKVRGRNFKKTDYSPLAAVPLIQVPVLLIHGQHDELFPHTNTQKLSSLNSKCRTWFPENGTHSDLFEQPGYQLHVENFLKLL